jgi:hypothetical protein
MGRQSLSQSPPEQLHEFATLTDIEAYRAWHFRHSHDIAAKHRYELRSGRYRDQIQIISFCRNIQALTRESLIHRLLPKQPHQKLPSLQFPLVPDSRV